MTCFLMQAVPSGGIAYSVAISITITVASTSYNYVSGHLSKRQILPRQPISILVIRQFPVLINRMVRE